MTSPSVELRAGYVQGRLAEHSWLPKDPLPAVGSTCLLSGANGDVNSDQHRGYTRVMVLAYSPCGKFGCFQKANCWPFVERLENCWFAEIDTALSPAPAQASPQPVPGVTALLQKIADYNDGKAPYKFRHDMQGGQDAFDAWQVIRAEIDNALRLTPPTEKHPLENRPYTPVKIDGFVTPPTVPGDAELRAAVIEECARVCDSAMLQNMGPQKQSEYYTGMRAMAQALGSCFRALLNSPPSEAQKDARTGTQKE